jgi:hypothetical protein
MLATKAEQVSEDRKQQPREPNNCITTIIGLGAVQ